LNSNTTALIAFLAGIFVMVAVVSDWNRFFENQRARLFVERFGRQGARIFYAILGCAPIGLGFACRIFSSSNKDYTNTAASAPSVPLSVSP
jgi:predicted small integral membrane protein